LKKNFRNYLGSDGGNAESAMVLIPLIFLFLCGIQLVTSIFQRNLELSHAQNEASIRAISGDFQSHDSIIRIETGEKFNQPEILIVRRERNLPILIPGLSENFATSLSISAKGIAVLEPNS